MKWITAAAALAVLVLVPAASARTWNLHGLGLAIVLPHGWLQKPATTGWRFEAALPTTGTGIFVNSFPLARDPGGTFHHDLIAFETKVAQGADRHATIASRGTTVAGQGAIEIIARYSGLTAYLFGFRHGNEDYTLEFVAKTAQLPLAKPEFTAALKSVRFIG